MKHVEAAQVLDIEMLGKIRPQFRRGEEMKDELDMAAVTKFDFELVSAIIVSEPTRLLNRIDKDSRSAADSANCGYEAP